MSDFDLGHELLDVLERRTAESDFRQVATQNYYIRTEDTRGITLWDPWWNSQNQIHAATELCLSEGRPVRVVVDKPRRVGSSLYCCARCYNVITGGPFRHGLFVNLRSLYPFRLDKPVRSWYRI